MIKTLFFSLVLTSSALAQIAERPYRSSGNTYHGPSSYHPMPQTDTRIRTSPTNWNTCSNCGSLGTRLIRTGPVTSIKMSKYCRLPDGNFQAFTKEGTVNLVPATDEVAEVLEMFADKAATEGDVTFNVSASVLSTRTAQIPRGNGSVEFSVLLVRKILR